MICRLLAYLFIPFMVVALLMFALWELTMGDHYE